MAWLAGAIRHQRTGSAGATIEEQLPVHNPSLGPVAGAFHMRYAVAPTILGKALGTQVRLLLNVIIHADDTIFQSHGNPALNLFPPTLSLRPRRRVARFRKAA